MISLDDGACPVVDCVRHEAAYPCRECFDITTDRCRSLDACKCSVAEVCAQRDVGGAAPHLCERDDSDIEAYSWTAAGGTGGANLVRDRWCLPAGVDTSTDDHCQPGRVDNAIPGGFGTGGYACCAKATSCVLDGPANTCTGHLTLTPGLHWLCYNSIWLGCADLANFDGLQVDLGLCASHLDLGIVVIPTVAASPSGPRCG